ncbi:putative CheA signal transduction histidine kinase ['Nostoc azollae' 0708]|uniref:Putative CheA signal transduction histidine kinase n=2 Tax=Trichormus azollae TaxID=1164 RepID=D7DW03_NOSA0|nr:putative CheA signal transduction histidine kinase ['Nostoc azollae' 0708]
MNPEKFQNIIGYYVEESQEHLNTIYNGSLNMQNTIDDRYELEAIFPTTFSLKGGPAMLGFTSLQKIVHNLEDCLQLLPYPIIANEPLQLLFLDIYHVLKQSVFPIKINEGVTT